MTVGLFLQWDAGGVTPPKQVLYRLITKFAISVGIVFDF